MTHPILGSEELTAGYYFCPDCDRKTMHELMPVYPPHYEVATIEEIAEAEANVIPTCTNCLNRAEREDREERGLD